jgi:hypothetical protein
MKTTHRTSQSALPLLALALTQLATSGCVNFNPTRYSDGPLTQYFGRPIPKLDKPIARTLSLEKVAYTTSVNMKAIMIGDLVAREIYVLPEEVGREVKQLLNLDNEFSEEATYAALNTIAKNRAKARSLRGNQPVPTPPATTSASTQAYIQRQEGMAREAYRKGDYLGGDIHNSAAQNAMMIDQSFGRAQASANLAFSIVGGLQAAGEGIIKSDFVKLRKWIESGSGAIGPQAPEGNHLSVFFLQFFDAESFQLDSRNRVAVFMVLTGPGGNSTSVLEGSDILTCGSECKLFKPKPTAKVIQAAGYSADVQKQLGTVEGRQYLIDNGFDFLSGLYQYLLLQHGLQKLRKGL